LELRCPRPWLTRAGRTPGRSLRSAFNRYREFPSNFQFSRVIFLPALISLVDIGVFTKVAHLGNLGAPLNEPLIQLAT
jgi:hypothetical protein